MGVDWRVYGPETVAAQLDKSELPGFFRDVVVSGSEVALIIRNGKIDETLTEGRHGTSGWRDRLKGLFGKAADVQVVFVDTSPFALKYYLGESTRSEAACPRRRPPRRRRGRSGGSGALPRAPERSLPRRGGRTSLRASQGRYPARPRRLYSCASAGWPPPRGSLPRAKSRARMSSSLSASSMRSV